jgi:hypothetical protein
VGWIRELTAQPQVESAASGSARRREATRRADGGGEDAPDLSRRRR